MNFKNNLSNFWTYSDACYLRFCWLKMECREGCAASKNFWKSGKFKQVFIQRKCRHTTNLPPLSKRAGILFRWCSNYAPVSTCRIDSLSVSGNKSWWCWSAWVFCMKYLWPLKCCRARVLVRPWWRFVSLQIHCPRWWLFETVLFRGVNSDCGRGKALLCFLYIYVHVPVQWRCGQVFAMLQLIEHADVRTTSTSLKVHVRSIRPRANKNHRISPCQVIMWLQLWQMLGNWCGIPLVTVTVWHYLHLKRCEMPRKQSRSTSTAVDTLPMWSTSFICHST